MFLCIWKNVCEFARKLIKINDCLGYGMDGMEKNIYIATTREMYQRALSIGLTFESVAHWLQVNTKKKNKKSKHTSMIE